MRFDKSDLLQAARVHECLYFQTKKIRLHGSVVTEIIAVKIDGRFEMEISVFDPNEDDLLSPRPTAEYSTELVPFEEMVLMYTTTPPLDSGERAPHAKFARLTKDDLTVLYMQATNGVDVLGTIQYTGETYTIVKENV